MHFEVRSAQKGIRDMRDKQTKFEPLTLVATSEVFLLGGEGRWKRRGGERGEVEGGRGKK